MIDLWGGEGPVFWRIDGSNSSAMLVQRAWLDKLGLIGMHRLCSAIQSTADTAPEVMPSKASTGSEH